MDEKIVTQVEQPKDGHADIDKIFDTLITTGRVELEREIFPGFTVKVRPLNTSEQLFAESKLAIANNPDMPRDVVQRARMLSILSDATIAINGKPIISSEFPDEMNAERRRAMNTNYMKLPPDMIDQVFALYLEAVGQQNRIYSDGKGLKEGVSNF